MAFVDDPNKNSQDGSNVNATPLSNAAPEQTGAANMAPQGDMGASQSSQIQSGSQTPSTNKKAPKASSGMFTNIQKYVDKNKPQAAKMAGAVTQDVGNQAAQIKQAVDSQKAQQSKVLTDNSQTLADNTTWAQNQVNSITNPQAPAPAPTQATQQVEQSAVRTAGPVTAPEAPIAPEAPTPYQPAEADISRFQDLMAGNVQGLQEVGNLNVSEQASRAQALQGLAQSANTEQGRRNLLGKTFQKQGAYGRGVSGLDSLITSGDQAARESLIQGTQAQAQGLQDNIQGAMKSYSDQKAAQDLQARNIGSNITGFGTDATTGIDANFQQSLDDELATRQGLEGAYDQGIISADDYLTGMKSQLEGKAYGDSVGGLIEDAYKNSGIRSRDARTTNLEGYAKTLREGGDVNKAGIYSRGMSGMYGVNEDNAVQTGWHKNKKSINSLVDQINNKFAGNDVYDIAGVTKGRSTKDGKAIYNALAGSQGQLLDQYNRLGSGSDVVGKAIQGLAGQSFEDYISGQGLDKYDTASEQDVGKYNALQKLMGNNDIVDGQRSTDFTQSKAIQDLLAKYNS